jgi:hypothetical protein
MEEGDKSAEIFLAGAVMVDALLEAYQKGDTQKLISLLEDQALAASRVADQDAFHKAYAQLASFYGGMPFSSEAVSKASTTKSKTTKRTTRATAAAMPQATSQRPLITALHLLSLLTRQDVAAFHTCLESLPQALLSTPEVTWAAQLEQHITEGSYQEVHALLSSPPSTTSPDAFRALAQQVSASIQREIADCVGSAYTSLPMVNLAALLMMPDGSKQAIRALCDERGWQLDAANGRVLFKPSGGGAPTASRLAGTNNAEAMAVDQEDMSALPGADSEAYGGDARRAMLSQTLGYARELESIV